MKKKITLFMVMVFITVLFISSLSFFIVGVFVPLGGVEISLKIEVILYTTFLVTVMVFILNSQWFFLKIDEVGIKHFFKSYVPWDEIVSVEVRGVLNIYWTKVIIFRTENETSVELKLFPFKDPVVVCAFLKKKLPWLSGFDILKGSFSVNK